MFSQAHVVSQWVEQTIAKITNRRLIMAMNSIQFQPGMSLSELFEQYGTERQCEQAPGAGALARGLSMPALRRYQPLLFLCQGHPILAMQRLSNADESAFGVDLPWLLARISHSPGHHSDFGQDVEHKSDEEGWAG
jgi:hypothetical protein